MEDEKQSRPTGRRRRRLFIALGVCVVLVLAMSYASRTPSPVGHWTSAEGREAFLAHYDETFADMPSPDEALDIRTDYGLVRAYHFAGTGDAEAPLVMLPGRSSASPVWGETLNPLLEIGDVYTIDLLGEPGLSIQDRPIASDEEQAEWLEQTLEGLPEDTFNVVGLSIGGWTAANLAVHTTDQLASMTLIDPVFVFDGMPLKTIFRSIPAASSWMPKSWRDGFNSYTAGGAPVEDEPVAEMIEAGMKHYALKLPQPTLIAEDQLADLDIPVLAILAGESVMHDSESAIATAERVLPNGTVQVYPDASHAVHGEYPEEVAADIAEFVRAQT
ncbi:alpha/beta hydrolase [Spiractinospora alimapuensis]|uniref:alpha/beta fold hydrolase n=1 Tax=Spiractinospora alimapuensis TaxID=2820884 RepID=UPI001F35C3FB|nr:alpha/beta hydrolase [Spiractinospora alimapuensis]QVQ51550.1 alpha/beta hydrolase [Spiractinospora alimapuensis]